MIEFPEEAWNAEWDGRELDRASQGYWENHWGKLQNPAFRPDSPAIRYHVDRVFAALLAEALKPLPRDATVLEAGCADSFFLPYLATMGYRIAGIDYSPTGCEQLRTRLIRAGIPATIECADIFQPTQLRADLVISAGLVEHFDDTVAVVRAISELAKPRGRVCTIIPNMRGLVGLAQRLLAPSVYAVHVPVSLERLKRAHEAVGLRVLKCEYLLPMGFGVLNPYEPGSSRAALLLRRMTYAVLTRLSWISWMMDSRLPRSELLSPYCYCLSEKD